jgi:hypothetical protein
MPHLEKSREGRIEVLSDEGHPVSEIKKQFNEVKIQTMEKGPSQIQSTS